MSESEVAVLQEQIRVLFSCQEKLEKQHQDFAKETKDTVTAIYNEIKALRDQLSSRLPLWNTWLMVVAGSVITGLVVALVS